VPFLALSLSFSADLRTSIFFSVDSYFFSSRSVFLFSTLIAAFASDSSFSAASLAILAPVSCAVGTAADFASLIALASYFSEILSATVFAFAAVGAGSSSPTAFLTASCFLITLAASRCPS